MKERRLSDVAEEAILLTETQAAQLMGLTPRALQQWRRQGIGPRWVVISARCIRYQRAEIVSWTEKRIVGSTAEARENIKVEKLRVEPQSA